MLNEMLKPEKGIPAIIMGDANQNGRQMIQQNNATVEWNELLTYQKTWK